MFVFLDSSVVIAALNHRDSFHELCREFLDQQQIEDVYVTFSTKTEVSGAFQRKVNLIILHILREVRGRKFDLSDSESKKEFGKAFDKILEDLVRVSEFVYMVKDSCGSQIVGKGRMSLDFLPEWGLEYGAGIERDILLLIGDKQTSDLPSITTEEQVRMLSRLKAMTSEVILPKDRDEGIFWELIANRGRFSPSSFYSLDKRFVKRAKEATETLVSKGELTETDFEFVLLRK